METNINHTDNFSLGELLTAYYNNGLSSSEKSNLESQAESDPFLSDAMEGFNEFPQAANEIPSFKARSTNFGWLTFGGIAILGIVGSLFFFNSGPVHIIPQSTEVNTIALVKKNDKLESIEETKSQPSNSKTIDVISTTPKTKNVGVEPNPFENNEPELIEERQTIVFPKIELTKKEYKEKQEIHVRKAKTKSIGYYGFLAVDYSLIYSNEIPVKNQFSGTDASRSDRNDESIIPDNSVSTTHYSYKDYLKSTCKYMKNRNFIPAILNFKTILKHFPSDVNAEFYLGYCYYELGKFDKAIPYFDLAMNNGFDFFFEDSQWFKANSLENLGKIEEAQEIYRKIKQNGGFYSHKLR